MSGWGAGYPGVPSDVAKKARQTAAQGRDRPSTTAPAGEASGHAATEVETEVEAEGHTSR